MLSVIARHFFERHEALLGKAAKNVCGRLLCRPRLGFRSVGRHVENSNPSWELTSASRVGRTMVPIMLAVLPAFAGFGRSRSAFLDEGVASSQQEESDGMSEKQVLAYIEEVLAQQELYMKDGRMHIPLFIQKQMFRQLIMMCLDLAEQQMHNLAAPTSLLDHEICAECTQIRCLPLKHLKLVPNDAELQRIVDEKFMPNRKINIWWLPDSIERPFYLACLRVLKTVLIDLMATQRVTIMGQELTLQPSQFQSAPSERLTQARAKLASTIDFDKLDSIVQKKFFAGSAQRTWLDMVLAPMERPLYTQICLLTLVFFEEFCSSSSFEFSGFMLLPYLGGPVHHAPKRKPTLKRSS